MLPIPPDLLSQNAVPPYQQPHYLKWLRFYLDFCSKYGQRSLERESVPAFLRTLEEKGQPDWMRKPAVDAVRLFFLQSVGQCHPQARPSTGRPARGQPAAAPDEASARSSVRSAEGDSNGDLASSPSFAGRPGPTPPTTGIPTRSEARHGTSIDEPSTPKLESRHADFSTSAPAESKTAAAPDDWSELYGRLADAIAVRNYSRKTRVTSSGSAKW
jgi:hypothetical protein